MTNMAVYSNYNISLYELIDSPISLHKLYLMCVKCPEMIWYKINVGF